MSSITDLISVGVNGTGTANYLMKWLDADTATDSVIYDDGTNVGIGTTSPTTKLQVLTSGTTPNVSVFNSGNAAAITSFTARAGLEFISYQSATGSPFTKTSAIIANGDGTVPAELQFWTKADGSSSPTERMRIDSSGNVGIGTTLPSTAITQFGGGAKGLAVASAQPVITLEDTTASTYSYMGMSNNDVYIDNIANGFIRFSTNGSERMRIDSSGRVGIGTSSPNSLLNVVGGGAVNGLTIKSSGNIGTFPLRVTWANGTDGDWLCVDASGNVGIGTSSPSAKLHLNSGTSNVCGLFESTDAVALVALKDNTTTATNSVAVGAEGDNLTFYAGSTGQTERMRITSGGNVQTQGTIQNDNFGVPMLDATAQFSIANGGTYTVGALSGVVIINNRSQGSVEMFLVGGGGVTSLGNSNGSSGSLAFSGGNYVFTNNTGSTAFYSIMILKTRPAA